MKTKSFHMIRIINLWLIITVLTSSRVNSEIYPGAMNGLKEIYTARYVIVGWQDFSTSESSEAPRGKSVVGWLYAPVSKISLIKPLNEEMEPRCNVDQKAIPVALEPLGYFMAFASDGSAWLIVVERHYYFTTIYRIRNAAEDPEFSKLYWLDIDEPHFQLQSRFPYELMEHKNNH